MNKQKPLILLLILIAAAIYSYTGMPMNYQIEGGSCYQGITSAIIKFILTICVILNLVAIMLIIKSKVNTPKTLSVFSIVFWSLIAFFNTIDETSADLIIGLKYFTPFLIANVVIIIFINKTRASNPSNKVTSNA